MNGEPEVGDKKNAIININVGEYREQLLAFLKYMADNGDFNENIPHVCVYASTLRHSLNYRYTNSNWRFQTTPVWDIEIQHPSLEGYHSSILIGGSIHVNENKFSQYSLSMSLAVHGSKDTPPTDRAINTESCCKVKYNDYNRIIRRLHFDIDNESDNTTPNSHLQIGGEIRIDSLPYPQDQYHYCSDHYLEIPRIPYPPIDIVLLFDFIFRHFDSDLGNRIKNDGTWRKIVRRSQNIIVNDYYNSILNHLTGDNPTTIHEFICGN